MPVNAIKDRVVQNFQLNASELLISFLDDSTMTLTIAECNSPPLYEDLISSSWLVRGFSGQERCGRVSRTSCGRLSD